MTDLVNFAKDSLRVSNGALIIVIFAMGTALLYLRPRLGRRCLAAAALVLLFVSTPVGNSLLIAPLVRGFHAIEDPNEAGTAGAIVVLGGGVRDMKVGHYVFAYPHEGTTLRVLEATRVFHLMGGRLPIVASGGFTVAGRRVTEASVMADVLVALGVPRERILIEDRSRNTREQALEVTRLLRGHGITSLVLVTAPTHLWRSTLAFRAQNVEVTPSAAALVADYTRERRFFTPNADSLQISDHAIYDYAGMVYYWSRGWLRAPEVDAAR